MTSMNINSISLQVLHVDQILEGGSPTYEKAPDATAFVFKEDGLTVLAIQKPRCLTLPWFEAFPGWDPDVEDCIVQAYLQAREIPRVFGLLDSIATSGVENINPDLHTEGDPLSSGLLADGFALIERNDGIRCAHWFLHPDDFSEASQSLQKVFEPETDARSLELGLSGEVWGIQVVVNPKVPSGTSYLCCGSKDLGRISVRPGKQGGIGMGVLEPRGFVRIIFD